MQSGKARGDMGERLVEQHLRRMGWTVLECKFRCPEGEVDIIAEDSTGQEPTLVFLEVKTRGSARCGTPGEAVDAVKQRRLMNAARHYLGRRQAGGPEPACRFDVAEVQIGPDGLAQIVLHRAAFGSGDG